MIGVLLATALSLQPCEVRDLKAQCGTFTVPENPSRRTTRFIELNVVVIPGTKRHEDALFVLAGGPGVAATGMASFARRTFAGSERDIVLVDARGTGRSNPLRCEAAAMPQELFGDLMAPERVKACLRLRRDVPRLVPPRPAPGRLQDLAPGTGRPLADAARSLVGTGPDRLRRARPGHPAGIRR